MLTRHPLSAVWGDMPADEYQELVESIREHGLLDRMIWTLNGQVLDGWHRYRACLEAGNDQYMVLDWPGGNDPVERVIAKNALRRHLTVSQRASAIAACQQWRRQGGAYDLPPGPENETLTRPDSHKGAPGAPLVNDDMRAATPPPTIAEVSVNTGISPRTQKQANRAERAGIGEHVRSGELSAKAADEVVRTGLADEVKTGKLPPKEAAKEAHARVQAEKGPTKTERLEAEIRELRAEVEEKAQQIDDLQAEIRFLRGESSDFDHKREETFNGQRAQITALRSQVAEWQMKFHDLQVRHKGALRRLKKLEGNP